jgi:excisionase family DNA binding protein
MHGEMINVTAVAERLGVGVRYVRRLVAEHRIPYFKVGRLLRFDADEVDAWLERGRVAELTSVRRPDARPPRRG